MGNDLIEETCLRTPLIAPEISAKCCRRCDEATVAPCVSCRRPVCRNCRRLVNDQRVCAPCQTRILTGVREEKASVAQLLPAVAGGVVAALLCGAAWTAMVVSTNMEIGYAAVGVGLATGYGVLLGAGKKRSTELQVVAVACAVLGLLLGKYFTMAYFVITNVKEAQGISYFDPRLFRIFADLLPQILSFWDALWAFIALRIAWKIPSPAAVSVEASKQKA